MITVTHNGAFHADDVFAAATLLIARPDTTIERTRDPQRIAKADLAFDVGGGKYDHHQPGGNGIRSNGIPFASFGLVWRDYGVEVVATLSTNHNTAWHREVADEVDRVLVCQIDADDNGVSLSDGTPVFADIRPVLLATVIGWLNPVDDELDPDKAFMEATQLAQLVLHRVVLRAAAAMEGRDIVSAAVADAADPRIVVLPAYVPDWKSQLVQTDALYAIYPTRERDGWRVQGVPVTLERYEVRRNLPTEWGGLNDAELAAVSGVADAVFCHRALFIAGAKSQAGAEALAQTALNADA